MWSLGPKVFVHMKTDYVKPVGYIYVLSTMSAICNLTAGRAKDKATQCLLPP